MNTPRRLPPQYEIIDLERHQQILRTPFNPPSGDGELNDVVDKLLGYFAPLGVFGSFERYMNGEDSDWWIADDGYSDWRSVGVDLLNVRLQNYDVIEGVRAILANLPERWLVFLYHDNSYDAKGGDTGEEGEYYIWITQEKVEIYSTGRNEIHKLLESFPLGAPTPE